MLPKTPAVGGRMKAVVLSGRMRLDVQAVPVPLVPPGGALIRVESVGLCGSDINRIRYTASPEPRVLGHELAGEVVALGGGAAGLAVGDRVAVGHVHVPCGHCVYCRHGTPAMCRQFKQTRIEPGGYAQFAAVSADHLAHTVLRLPPGVNYDQATFIDPVACCLRGVGLCQVQPFDRVVVVGAGIMGLLMLPLLRARGAEVLALDTSAYRLRTASLFGANQVANVRDGAAPEGRRAMLGGEGADSVLLTFVDQGSLALALALLRDGGRLCVFAPPVQAPDLSLDFFAFFRRELRMFSSYSATLADMGEALQWIASGRLNVERLITGHTSLEGLLGAVAALDEQQYKIIVKPWAGAPAEGGGAVPAAAEAAGRPNGGRREPIT